MSERLQVEVIRADELAVGDEAIIVEFRGKVAATRALTRNDGPHFRQGVWITLASDEGAELSSDSPVLRVVRAPAEPTEAHAKALAALLYEDQNPGTLGHRVWADIPPVYREAWFRRANQLLALVARAETDSEKPS